MLVLYHGAAVLRLANQFRLHGRLMPLNVSIDFELEFNLIHVFDGINQAASSIRVYFVAFLKLFSRFFISIYPLSCANTTREKIGERKTKKNPLQKYIRYYQAKINYFLILIFKRTFFTKILFLRKTGKWKCSIRHDTLD